MYYLLIRYANRQIGTLPPVRVRVLCICTYALDAARLLKMGASPTRLNTRKSFLQSFTRIYAPRGAKRPHAPKTAL